MSALNNKRSIGTDKGHASNPVLILDEATHPGIEADGRVEFRPGEGAGLPSGWYCARLVGFTLPTAIHASFDFGDGYRWSQGVDTTTAKLQRVTGDLWMLRRPLKGIRLEALHGGPLTAGKLQLKQLGRVRALSMLVAQALRSRRIPRLPDLIRTLRAKGTHGLADALYRFCRGDGWSPSLGYADSGHLLDATVPAPEVGGARISILMPTHNTGPTALRRCLDSVLVQSHPNWELSICDDASSRADVWDILQEYAQRDDRIVLSRLSESEHISGATNHALRHATGEFIALLDHDDELHPHAVGWLADALGRNPGWDMIYTDEDKLGLDGLRFDPCFKPDFNIDLLRAQNCVGHFSAYRRGRIEQLGGLRKGFEGSQDWDLALRMVDAVGSDRIGHVRRVLYHWRVSDTSTALSSDAKPYARDAAKRAIVEHLQRNAIEAEVHELAGLPGRYRIVYPAPVQRSVELVVVGNGYASDLGKTLASLPSATAHVDLDVRVVCQSQGELDVVATQLRPVEVVEQEPGLAWSDTANRISRESKADFIVIVPAGLVGCMDDWLDELLRQAARCDVAVASPKIYDADGRIWSCGIVSDAQGVHARAYEGMPAQYAGMAERALLVRNVVAVADCVSFQRDRLLSLGPFVPGLGQEAAWADLGRRAVQHGLLNVWTPFSEMRWTTQ